MNTQEFLQKTERILGTLPQRVQNRPRAGQTIIPKKQIITVKEAKAMGAVAYMAGSDKTLLLKGDVFVQGNIDGGRRGELLKGDGAQNL